jgi:hypothetical protein
MHRMSYIRLICSSKIFIVNTQVWINYTKCIWNPTHEHHMSNKVLGKDSYLLHVDFIILFAPLKPF